MSLVDYDGRVNLILENKKRPREEQKQREDA